MFSGSAVFNSSKNGIKGCFRKYGIMTQSTSEIEGVQIFGQTHVILVIFIDYLSHVGNMEKSRKLFKTGICLKIPYIPTKNLLQYHYRKLCILHPFAGFPKNGGTPKIIHVIFGFSIIFISKYMMWSISGFFPFPSSYCGTLWYP